MGRVEWGGGPCTAVTLHLYTVLTVLYKYIVHCASVT